MAGQSCLARFALFILTGIKPREHALIYFSLHRLFPFFRQRPRINFLSSRRASTEADWNARITTLGRAHHNEYPEELTQAPTVEEILNMY